MKNKTENSETEAAANKLIEVAADNLSAELKSAIKDLFYVSETDAGFETVYLTAEKPAEAFSAVSPEVVLRLAAKPPETPIREVALADFFGNLTVEKDWYGDEEKAVANRFRELQKLLEQKLRDARVFKIGQIELEIYLVGIDEVGNIAGVKTNAVET